VFWNATYGKVYCVFVHLFQQQAMANMDLSYDRQDGVRAPVMAEDSSGERRKVAASRNGAGKMRRRRRTTATNATSQQNQEKVTGNFSLWMLGAIQNYFVGLVL
jgi:hypothetical protein